MAKIIVSGRFSLSVEGTEAICFFCGAEAGRVDITAVASEGPVEVVLPFPAPALVFDGEEATEITHFRMSVDRAAWDALCAPSEDVAAVVEDAPKKRTRRSSTTA